MPIYAYRCERCGHAKDVLQKISDPVLTVCPACGEPALRKQVTAAGFQLKGSGWYVTDFRGDKSAGKADSVEKAAGEANGKAAEAAPAATEGAGKAAAAPAAKSADAAPSPAAATTSSPAPAPSGSGSGSSAKSD
jgi:putative FmdB family regulatory protein